MNAFLFMILLRLYLFLVLVDSQPTMEETILVGDDLMTGPASPVIPPEIASHVLEGVDICDGKLRNLFLCKDLLALNFCCSFLANFVFHFSWLLQFA